MLALLFHIGPERFGLNAAEITEVVPFVELSPPSEPSDFIAGEFSLHGTVVPVIDLGRLVGQSPCPALLSTRIILVRLACPNDSHRLVGLLAEKVTETITITAEQFHTTEKSLSEEAFKTPLPLGESGTVQLLHLDRLLPMAVRDLLFQS